VDLVRCCKRANLYEMTPCIMLTSIYITYKGKRKCAMLTRKLSMRKWSILFQNLVKHTEVVVHIEKAQGLLFKINRERKE
jgi:hypothetical protein